MLKFLSLPNAHNASDKHLVFLPLICNMLVGTLTLLEVFFVFVFKIPLLQYVPVSTTSATCH